MSLRPEHDPTRVSQAEMTIQFNNRVSILIAHAAASRWPGGLTRVLTPLPVDIHMARTDNEAMDLLARLGSDPVRGIHVGVVDDELPGGGGLDLLRRIRRLGLEFACVLVSPRPSERLLQDALRLDVFSVVPARKNAAMSAVPNASGAEDGSELITPALMRVVRQKYHVDWPVDLNSN